MNGLGGNFQGPRPPHFQRGTITGGGDDAIQLDTLPGAVQSPAPFAADSGIGAKRVVV